MPRSDSSQKRPRGLRVIRGASLLPRLLVLVGLLLAPGCDNAGRGAPRKDGPSGSALQESWNSTIILSQKGALRLKLRAGHILDLGRDSYAIDGGVEAEFFGESGDRISSLVADSAQVTEGKTTRVLGSVILRSNDGSTLETSELVWDDQAGMVRTEKLVTLSTSDGVEKGTDFRSTADLKRWSMRSVTGRSLRDLREGR